MDQVTQKGEQRFVKMVSSTKFVMMVGAKMMLKCSVLNLMLQFIVSHTLTILY